VVVSGSEVVLPLMTEPSPNGSELGSDNQG
jgi:hypothetical protein